MVDLCCPGTGALKGIIVGTATAPAVILKLSLLVQHETMEKYLDIKSTVLKQGHFLTAKGRGI